MRSDAPPTSVARSPICRPNVPNALTHRDQPRDTLDNMDYRDILTIEPGKRGGKPCIRGLRITVYDVLGYLASGMTIDEILADFPYLTRNDVLACLAYAADRERTILLKPA